MKEAKMASRVYVTQEANLNFTPAEKYGEVTFLTRDDLVNTKGSLHNEEVLASIAFKLKGYDPQQDWLVVAGSPYVSAAVFMILGRMGHRSIRILRWDNRDFVYVPMYLDLRSTDHV